MTDTFATLDGVATAAVLAERFGWRVTRLPLAEKHDPDWRKGDSWAERATNDLAAIKDWPEASNFAVPARLNGLLILDEDQVDALKNAGVTLPPTFTVKTLDGFHYYFRADRDSGFGQGAVWAGVDVRWDGYVVGPGSVHPDTGVVYTVLDDRTPTPVPPDVQAALLETAERSPEAELVSVEDVENLPATPLSPAQEGYLKSGMDSVLRELDNLSNLAERQRNDRNQGWDSGTYHKAARLLELRNAAPQLWSLDEVRTEFLSRAPCDGSFPANRAVGKWNAALRKVGTEAADVPNGDDLGDVLAATPVLQHIQQAARARMLNPQALLGYVLVRVLAEIPAHISLPPVIGGPASLNLGVAVVGKSGGGKSALLSVSRELLGAVGAGQKSIERSLGSGEGLAQTFLRWNTTKKENVLVPDPRRIMTVDEIDQLGAAQNRSGATVAPTLRTALTGGQLGQENAATDRRRLVPEGAYRLTALVGVQPTRSGVLLNDTDAGSPQRFVWVPAADPSIPDEDEPWPGELEWDLPDALAAVDFIEYPANVRAEIREARREQMRHDTDGLEGHLMLTRLKVAAGLAVLHGDPEITDVWWRLARRVVDASIALQEKCRAALIEASKSEQRHRGKLDADRERGRAEARDERVVNAAQAIWRKVQRHSTSPKDGNDQKHDPGKGCTARCIARALRDYPDRSELRDPAWEYAQDEDWIEERGDRWFPSGSQPSQ